MESGVSMHAGAALERALETTAVSARQLTASQNDRLQELARGLLDQIETVAEEVNRRAIAGEPGLADWEDLVAVGTVMQSTRANVGAIIAMLAYGMPAETGAPAEGALRLFERLAEREQGLAIILRGYRLGIMELWQIWARYLAENIDDADELYAIQAASTSVMLTYIDRVSAELHEQWRATRRRHRLGPEDLIRGALFGPPESADLSALEYSLERSHTATALDPGLDDGVVAGLVSRLALDCAARTCVLRLDTAWVVWLATERPMDAAAIARLTTRVSQTGGAAGIGQAASGPAGFQATYRQALDARRVGLLRRSGGVTHHRDVALLAVLCADTERARELSLSELGALAARDDAGAARLRETLAAYLSHGENQLAAAHALGVHVKTVAYRLRQAEALLGRRLTERRVELEAALLLHGIFRDTPAA